MTEISVEAPLGSSKSQVQRQQRRVWMSSFLGATIEFYDFSIYSTASALVFVPLFFSGVDPALGLVLSFATLAIGYAARPLGAFVFGHFGDKVGRKTTLILTIVLMAVATFLIGFLPTYEQIGVFAPIFLVTLRMIQGISVGGEWGGAVVMSTEHSSAKHRGFMGSATITGSSSGVLLGFAVFAVVVPLTGAGFMTWGWRIPFWITAVLFVLAIYIRLRVDETPIMVELKNQNIKQELPLKLMFTKYLGRMIKASAVFFGPMLVQSLMITFFISYSVTDLGASKQSMVNASMIGVAASFIGIPIAGLLTDRFGRRKILGIGILLAILNSLLILPLLSSGSFGLVVLSFCLVFAIHSLCIAPLGALYSEMFPSSIRYTGVSVTYQVASLVGGGLGPLAASAMIALGMGTMSVVIMIIVMLLVSGLAIARLPKTIETVDLRDV